MLIETQRLTEFTNSTIAIKTGSELIPLKTQHNEDIEDFPMTVLGGIDRANSTDLS